MDVIIEISEAVPRQEHVQFKRPVNFQIREGQHWAIIGANGSGKTQFVDLLLGKYALKNGVVVSKNSDGDALPISAIVKSVAFRDIYSIMDTQNSYYQQRWNKGDDQDLPIVRDLVDYADKKWLNTLLNWFGISELMDKEVTSLSSGELRKFLIVKSLIEKPRVLILDNPFIGLDASSRITLNELLVRLSELDGLQIVLVLPNVKDIPDVITHVLPLKNKELLPVIPLFDFKRDTELINYLFEKREGLHVNLLKDKLRQESSSFNNSAVLKNIEVRYGKRTILRDLSWTVSKGDKWALLGANGAGKSTLLSLICGDNPQAYANDITLFDKKRGTGESIWDIKRRIGYISPEMHLYYLKNVKSLDVVGSGFFDTIGLYRKCDSDQELIALAWMEIFGVSHLKDISFLHISSGEQRLVLLARVFVKNPDLLILDEPLHGLDAFNKNRVKKIIEDFCDVNKSLIYVTHYEDEIPNVVDKRLVLLKNG
ncbi:ATP-binding cassette domain-containing protein [Dysgonomonas sp. Marseille-P4677]|uniref:ATP-binding cassette domain-containing protein n=1 Tax=Dysgonomonas sp. Marseille-P4677 TaxID=2364790 RepID=UPI001911A538|nr:ATP-binding cassette domain-containing protein [Dysgonomonas sp. Marseille-P4677]